MISKPWRDFKLHDILNLHVGMREKIYMIIEINRRKGKLSDIPTEEISPEFQRLYTIYVEYLNRLYGCN